VANGIVLNENCANLSALLTEESTLGPQKTYPFQGRQVKGQSVEFEAKSEPWNQYSLADGTQLKAKMVLLDVVRLEEYNDKGDPVYQFSLQQIIGTEIPEELKRKKQ
jgi:hypothetical protein